MTMECKINNSSARQKSTIINFINGHEGINVIRRTVEIIILIYNNS